MDVDVDMDMDMDMDIMWMDMDVLCTPDLLRVPKRESLAGEEESPPEGERVPTEKKKSTGSIWAEKKKNNINIISRRHRLHSTKRTRPVTTRVVVVRTDDLSSIRATIMPMSWEVVLVFPRLVAP